MINFAQGYLSHGVKFGQWKHWISITSRLKSLESSDDFACARVCVEFRFHLVIPIACACVCACTASENRALQSICPSNGLDLNKGSSKK